MRHWTRDCFDKVIVSTDDPEIALVSKKYGASMPFIRPSDLAGDFMGTAPVVNHAINHLILDNLDNHVVCCLYATAPFVTSDLLRKGLHLLRSNPEKSFVFTATEYPYPIQKALCWMHQRVLSLCFILICTILVVKIWNLLTMTQVNSIWLMHNLG